LFRFRFFPKKEKKEKKESKKRNVQKRKDKKESEPDTPRKHPARAGLFPWPRASLCSPSLFLSSKRKNKKTEVETAVFIASRRLALRFTAAFFL
jgi:hypothetical protein